MTAVTSTELMMRPGKVMEMVKSGPVHIQSHGRDVAVLLDHQEYERLKTLEDASGAGRAETAKQQGFLSTEQTQALIKDLLSRNGV